MAQCGSMRHFIGAIKQRGCGANKASGFVSGGQEQLLHMDRTSTATSEQNFVHFSVERSDPPVLTQNQEAPLQFILIKLNNIQKIK